MSIDGEQAADPRVPWAAVAGVTVSLSIFGVAQSLSYPLFTLVMQKQGMPPGLIGLSAAMLPVGILLSAPLVPLAVNRLGARRLAVLCALGGAACFLLMGLLQNFFAWFPLRLLLGILVNPLYILGEVWALALSPAAQRGRVMGFFNTLMGVGYAIGPLVLTVLGTAGLAPFLAAAVGFALCAATLHAVSGRVSDFAPREGEVRMGFGAFARQAPALLVAVGTAAATQQSTYALLAVFGTDYGLGEVTLAWLLTVLAAGNILFQVPLGLAAERVGGRWMILFCALGTVCCAALLPVFILSPLIWPLLLLLGGIGYGTYTMATVELGERFSGSALVAGNAAFALLWGAGGIAGAPVAGYAMQQVGPLGLPGTIVLLSSAMFVFVLIRTFRRRRRQPE